MINRNNYEEYFLLLADNELSAEEATAVKQFAAQHPDLAEELDILLSCRLDDVVIPVFPKEKLLRTVEWDAEKPEPEQTKMLLLLDGELQPEEQQQLQAAIAASATLQADWQSLQQTKLIAESIAHPYKESLRRTDRIVRPLLWMRWAAAAAVATGLGWLLWMQQVPRATSPDQNMVVTPSTKETPRAIAQNQSSSTQPMATLSSSKPAEITAAATAINREVATANQPIKEQVKRKHLPKDDSQVSNVYTQLTPAEPNLVLATLNSADMQLSAVNSNSNNAAQVAHLTAKPIATPMLAAGSRQETFTGKKEVLATEEDDYVTVGGAHINKQKIRGLFRNVTRTVARSFTKSKLEPDAYTTR